MLLFGWVESRSDENAIHSLSGDQAGRKSPVELGVRFLSFRLCMSKSQMFAFPPRVETKARDLPSGEKYALIVECWIVRQTLQVGTIRVDPVDISRPMPMRGKHDPSAVARKRRIVIDVWLGQQRPGIFAVAIGDEDVGLQGSKTGERDRVPVSGNSCRIRGKTKAPSQHQGNHANQ